MPTRLLLLLLVAFAPLAHGQAVMRNGDIFELQLSGMPIEFANEFRLQYTVGDDGEVSFPYIGSMKAAGLSTTQLARTVERKLVADKIFTTPTAVIMRAQQSQFVTVGGAVRAPQAVPWNTDMTLSNAIMRAGGTGDFGSKSKIKVTREGKITIYNLKRFPKDPTQNPKLLPGDEVEVTE